MKKIPIFKNFCEKKAIGHLEIEEEFMSAIMDYQRNPIGLGVIDKTNEKGEKEIEGVFFSFL